MRSNGLLLGFLENIEYMFVYKNDKICKKSLIGKSRTNHHINLLIIWIIEYQLCAVCVLFGPMNFTSSLSVGASSKSHGHLFLR